MKRVPADRGRRSRRIPLTLSVTPIEAAHPAVAQHTPEYENGCAGKLGHPTESAADAYVTERGWSRSRVSAYWCRLCGLWHLTMRGGRGHDE